MKKRMVIQEHNALRAGLHWDLRFEDKIKDKKILKSFVIPKHKFPVCTDQILALQVEDHAWSYRNFEGELGPGYGQGSVKMVFNNKVEIEKFEKKKIIFEYEGKKYQIYKCGWIANENAFMIKRKYK